jgi:NTE family protein
MRASSAVPGLRKPIPVDNKLFVDGGYLANLPVPHARALGGDIVIAVQIDQNFKIQTQNDFRKLGSVEERMFNLQLSALDAVHARKADILIHPNLDGIGLVSTKTSDAKKAIAAGEAAAQEALPTIKEKLQAVGIATQPGSI